MTQRGTTRRGTPRRRLSQNISRQSACSIPPLHFASSPEDDANFSSCWCAAGHRDRVHIRLLLGQADEEGEEANNRQRTAFGSFPADVQVTILRHNEIKVSSLETEEP